MNKLIDIVPINNNKYLELFIADTCCYVVKSTCLIDNHINLYTTNGVLRLKNDDEDNIILIDDVEFEIHPLVKMEIRNYHINMPFTYQEVLKCDGCTITVSKIDKFIVIETDDFYSYGYYEYIGDKVYVNGCTLEITNGLILHKNNGDEDYFDLCISTKLGLDVISNESTYTTNDGRSISIDKDLITINLGFFSYCGSYKYESHVVTFDGLKLILSGDYITLMNSTTAVGKYELPVHNIEKFLKENYEEK